MLNARRYTILHDPQCIRLAILLPTVDNSENEFTQFDGSVGKNEISSNKSFDQFSKWQLDDGLSLFSIFFSGTHFKRVMVPFVFCANSCTLNGVFCKCLALNHGKKLIFSSLKLLHIIFTSFHLNSKRRQFRQLFYSLSIFNNLKQKQHAEADIQKMKSNIACIANQRLCKILSNEKQF